MSLFSHPKYKLKVEEISKYGLTLDLQLYFAYFTLAL